jgi:hypothetical protein
MDPREAARALHTGRIAFGIGLVLAPRLVAGSWVGADNVPGGATVLARALGARDALMGALALHTLDNEQVAPRYLASMAAVDAVDAAAALVAMRHLPRGRGVLGVMVAGGSAAMGVALSRALAQQTA